MKNIRYILIAGLIAIMGGCNFLDYDQTSGRNKEEAYSYYANLNGLVAHLYSYLPSDFGEIGGAMMESATDNSVYTWEDNSIYHICNGIWSPLNTINDGWSYFKAIRSANSFLENFDASAIERFEFDDSYDAIKAKTSKLPFEARFLRAYFYFELAIRYGDIPLLTRTYEIDEINSVTPTPFDDIITFIINECDEIAPELPVDYKDFWEGTGRVTRGTVFALKSRVLLYAASAWHNPENSKSKWEEAAQAAYAIIKEGWYELPNVSSDPLYDKKGGNFVLSSPQLIFERRNAGKTNSFEARNQPMGYEGALGGNTPSQNLVDSYGMLNGEAFDWSNPEHVSNMYYNEFGAPTRDPRMYLNVLTNASVWLNRKVETFEEGNNKSLEGSTLTGYYLKKYMNPSVSLEPDNPNKIEHHYILFRYAEILLNYAEAMNEWLGPDATGEGCPVTAREALNMVRSSANMPLVQEIGSAFTAKVRNERRIELAFEGHRFWDIRRWKIAGDDDVRKVYGVKIVKDEDNLIYEKQLVQERFWNDKMYLFPYPQQELYINENLVQNPGW